MFVDRSRVKIAGRKVRCGQAVELFVAEDRERARTTEFAHELILVSETADFVVVDKPSGLYSAPIPESDQQDLLAHLKRRSNETEGEFFLVHRLDRPTSGLMVVAKTRAAAAHLSDQVASRRMKRRYEALLVGRLDQPETVSHPIDGKEAITEFAPLQQRGPLTWVSAELRTGRTHQVRIHATARGTPIVGDSKYGRALSRGVSVQPPRLALHAVELSFLDPAEGKVVRFSSPMPEDLQTYWERLPDLDPTC